MKQNNINYPTLKEIETDLFRVLQQSFSDVFSKLLIELDQQLAKSRDKARFQMKDKRLAVIDSMFGSIEVKRNYYYDRINKKYVFLLDQHLQFDGSKGLSPLVQEMAMELAVEGTSYRQAPNTLDKLLGYKVISHESIRQHLLQTEVVPSAPVEPIRNVLFVEVDGLYEKDSVEKNEVSEKRIRYYYTADTRG